MLTNDPREELISSFKAQATILVCDDEEVLRALIRATLDEERYRIIEAGDGDESLDQARRARPDLVVLDVMMPGRSGFEVLAELRRDPKLAEVKVLMLTARAQVSDRDAAVRAGADRYLAKPFSPSELALIVDEMLEESPST